MSVALTYQYRRDEHIRSVIQTFPELEDVSTTLIATRAFLIPNWSVVFMQHQTCSQTILAFNMGSQESGILTGYSF